MEIDNNKILLSTTPTIPGYKIVEYKGLVWGVTVKTRSILIDYFVNTIIQLIGGEIKSYTKMLEKSRKEVIERMKKSAQKKGANAIVEIIFDNEMETGNDKDVKSANTVVAYGTAVVVVPLKK